MRLFVAVRGFMEMNRDQPPALLEPKVYGEPPNLVGDGMPAYDTVNLDPSARPELRVRPTFRNVATTVVAKLPLTKT